MSRESRRADRSAGVCGGMSEWTYCTWGDLVTLEYGKSLNGYRESNGHVPVYGTNGLIGWNDSPLCDFPSVIIGRKGAYRGVHYSPEPFFVIDTAFYLKPRPNVEIDTKWAYYCLLAQDINSMDSGSAIPSTSRDDFYSLEASLPPLPEQRAIADILGSLDDKIEANRRQNETLEATARAIFKSWFVDFDPVHAKANGEASVGMDAETAALFPDSFEESELGLIPRGWGCVPLSEFLEVNPSRKLSKGELSPYLSMSNLPANSMMPDEWEWREFGSGMRFQNGDVLMARITPSLENGKTGYVSFLENEQIGWGSTEFIVLCSPEGYPPEYAYFLARNPDFRDYAIANMTGTSGRQRVPKECFDYYYIPVPPVALGAKFREVITAVTEQIKLNLEESRTLAETRDALLPRMVSGELRVGELEDIP